MTTEVTTTTQPTIESLQEEISRLRRSQYEERIKFVSTAQRYANNHGLCEVVDRALDEMGLLGITAGPQHTVDINIAAQLVLHMPDEAMLQEDLADYLRQHLELSGLRVEGMIGHVRKVSYGNRRNATDRINLQITDWAVNSVTEGDNRVQVPQAASAADDRLPDGFNGCYTSRQGRRKHVVRDGSPAAYVSALCGAYVNARLFDSPMQEMSLNGEQYFCQRCASYMLTNRGVSLPS